MTRLLLIGARRTGASITLVHAALRRHLNVTIISSEQDDLTGVFPDGAELVSVNIDDPDFIPTLLASYRHETLLVTTTSEPWAYRSARTAALVGCPGPDADVVERCMSKSWQKAWLMQNAIPCAKGRTISLTGLENGIDGMLFPVIIKPDKSTASFGVRYCASRDEALQHIATLKQDLLTGKITGLTDKALVETFIEGDEYCVEFFDGCFVGAMRKLKRYGREFYERGYTSELDLCEHDVTVMAECCRRAVEACCLAWGPVHIDCIVREHQCFIVELNPRMPGSFISDIIRDCYGFDMTEALLDKLMGREVTLPSQHVPFRYARAEFLLTSDPPEWQFSSEGRLSDGVIEVRYGPQNLPHRQRRAFIYLCMATEGENHEKHAD